MPGAHARLRQRQVKRRLFSVQPRCVRHEDEFHAPVLSLAPSRPHTRRDCRRMISVAPVLQEASRVVKLLRTGIDSASPHRGSTTARVEKTGGEPQCVDVLGHRRRV